MSTTEQRTAVVTGGGRGIGLEIARRLTKRGYAVLVTTRDADAGARAVAQLGQLAWTTKLDVRDPDQHREVAAEAASRGRLDVWVNNAGVLVTKPAWEHDDHETKLVIDTNLLGMINGCTAAIETMGAGGGKILNVASISAYGPVPGLSVYAATKAGIVSYTTSLQGDLNRAGHPIKVRALCPGPVATDMVTERAHDPHAAVLYSSRQLSPAEVADEALAVLDGRQIVHLMPGALGMLVKAGAMAPSLGLRVLDVVHALGQRKQAV